MHQSPKVCFAAGLMNRFPLVTFQRTLVLDVILSPGFATCVIGSRRTENDIRTYPWTTPYSNI